MKRSLLLAVVLCSVSTLAFSAPHFESPPVHPLDLDLMGQRLLAVHSFDHRLVVFDLAGAEPKRIAEIPVGIEPVTVRYRGADQAWVVNHQSDNLSVVDLHRENVIASLAVGDEPTDLIFAGIPERVFVCVSQEDCIKVYFPNNLSLPPTVIPLLGSDPRSMALSPDGSEIYVTIQESGNHTTVIPATTVTVLGGLPAPDPPMNGALPAAPEVGLIVQYDGMTWRDEMGADWGANRSVLYDHDMAVIDVDSRSVSRYLRGVGTTIFNVAAHPVSGELYVSNLEAFNLTRFEPNLKGRFLENRVTMLSPSGSSVQPTHLNPHIDYGQPDGNAGERAASLSIPLDLTVSPTRGEVYVAAMGSAQVGVLDTSGTPLRRIAVGQGPSGLALDDAAGLLYVLNRTDATITAIDLTTETTSDHSLGFDPVDPQIREGRRVFYDGENSSAHGDLSCASCHIFVGTDHLAWDLGDPQGSLIPVPIGANPLGNLPPFHPMKGPMMTQSLKALEGTEPFHWRGDRPGLAAFNGAFVSLMGRSASLAGAEFGAMRDFLFETVYPSNPILELDGSFPVEFNGSDPAHGKQLYLSGDLVAGLECVSCHDLPTGQLELVVPGEFLLQAEGKDVPQLRNLYEKTGFDSSAAFSVRGFGFNHDGTVEDLFTFLEFPAFVFNTVQDQRDVEAFLMCFDTGTPPAIGAQWTFDGANTIPGMSIVSTLESLADANTIGLIAKGKLFPGQPRGWVYLGSGQWLPDKSHEPTLTTSALLSQAGFETEITVTGVWEGEEQRLGIDRDGDGYRDGDELNGGSDPGDPNSTPSEVVTATPFGPSARGWELLLQGANPVRARSRLSYHIPRESQVELAVYDIRGRRVRVLLESSLLTAGEGVSSWDLRDDHGLRVSSGVYFLRLRSPEAVRSVRIAVVN